MIVIDQKENIACSATEATEINVDEKCTTHQISVRGVNGTTALTVVPYGCETAEAVYENGIAFSFNLANEKTIAIDARITKIILTPSSVGVAYTAAHSGMV